MRRQSSVIAIISPSARKNEPGCEGSKKDHHGDTEITEITEEDIKGMQRESGGQRSGKRKQKGKEKEKVGKEERGKE
jgi:hypothetical protein